MAELLPCPLCGHLNDKPRTRTKFNCRNKACAEWLELSKDHSHLQSYFARKEATKTSNNDWWHQQALIRQRKLNTDYDTARSLVLAEHHANSQKMRDQAAFAKLFPPDTTTSATKPQPQAFTNSTKPIVATSTTSDDDTDAPF